MTNQWAGFLGILTIITAAPTAQTEVRIAKILADHAVLQRQAPIHLWGSAAPGEHVTATLHTQTRTIDANDFGEWSLWLMPEQAGGPYTLNVTGSAPDSHPVAINDLLIGDVWVASGQSNMEMPLKGFGPGTPIKNSAQEIAAATQPQIRLLRISTKSSDIPVGDVSDTWTLCTPETAANFSAVAYFFGREINQKEHVPIGLIDSTWGGTPIESWISLDALGSDASLMPVFASRAHMADQQTRLTQVQAEEKREDATALAEGKPAPKHPWHPNQASWLPAGLYNGMIAPLTPYSIKGWLWYQGETNSNPERAPLYVKLMPAMIADWRKQWGLGDLPFLYVQISSFHSPQEHWGIIRDAQRRTLSVTDTAMAVSTDVGQTDNVHPPDKQTVGSRLALAARATVYGEKAPYTGPVFRQATAEPNGLRVWFDHAEGLKATPAESLTTDFELAGDDHNFVPAKAVIEGDTILVTNSDVRNPRYVRYLWDNESKGALYNKARLPASTFTSE